MLDGVALDNARLVRVCIQVKPAKLWHSQRILKKTIDGQDLWRCCSLRRGSKGGPCSHSMVECQPNAASLLLVEGRPRA
jgi:hypothetical protein